MITVPLAVNCFFFTDFCYFENCVALSNDLKRGGLLQFDTLGGNKSSQVLRVCKLIKQKLNSAEILIYGCRRSHFAA